MRGGASDSQVSSGWWAEIEDGSLDDPQDELLGILLKALYPKVLSMAEVQGYLREPKFAEAREYVNFWTEHVPKESTPEQLADLLDGIAERFAEYRPFMVGDVGLYTRLGQLPVELLMQVLRETRWRNHDRSVAADRLYAWLGVVSDPGLGVPSGKGPGSDFDLEWNSDALKALIAHCVEMCLSRGDECTDLVDRRPVRGSPAGIRQVVPDLALAAAEGKAASFYLQELFDCVMDGVRADGLTVEGARAGLAADEALVNQFDEMVKRRARVETRTVRRTAPESAATRSRRGARWNNRLGKRISRRRRRRCTRGGARRNCCIGQPRRTWGSRRTPQGRRPDRRLGDLVGGRVDLIDLLLVGMEGTIAREDLPGCDDVVRLFDRNRINWLVLPFVAGLHSLEQSNRLSANDLNESQTRLAVTILYMLPQKLVDAESADGTGTYRPAWFRTLLRDNPGAGGGRATPQRGAETRDRGAAGDGTARTGGGRGSPGGRRDGVPVRP